MTPSRILSTNLISDYSSVLYTVIKTLKLRHYGLLAPDQDERIIKSGSDDEMQSSANQPLYTKEEENGALTKHLTSTNIGCALPSKNSDKAYILTM